MERSNGIAQRRDGEVPPSSMIATHFGNGSRAPRLNAQQFAELIEESLGSNEDGEPNVGKDVAINLKLLTVVASAGIEPFLAADPDDPFHKRLDQAGGVEQLKSCLEVIQLTIIRTPRLIGETAFVNGVTQQDSILVIVWVFHLVLSVVLRTEDVSLLKRCTDIITACLEADEKCNCGTCGSVVDLARELVAALGTNSLMNTTEASNDQSLIDGDVKTGAKLQMSPLLTNVIERLNFQSQKQRVTVGIFIIKALLGRTLPRNVAMQLKKHLKFFDNSIQSDPDLSTAEPQIEGLKSQIGGLKLTSAIHSDYATTVNNDFPDTDRARKRPRLSTDLLDDQSSEVSSAAITETVTLALTGRVFYDFDSLAVTCVPHFHRLNEREKIKAMDLLGSAGCQLASGLTRQECTVCESTSGVEFENLSGSQLEQLLDTLEALQPQNEQGLAIQFAALEAYRRLLNHVQNASRLDLSAGAAGKYCLQMLRTTKRSLRLKAAQLLRTFVRDMPNDDFGRVKKNRITALAYLQDLWQSGRQMTQEAVIRALLSMAEVVGEDELNIILLRLIDYLGHPNAYISGLVAVELTQLAQTLHTNMQGLLRPFWRTLSVVVVRNLSARPAIAQQLCELLGMDINGLLQIIEEDAVPFLVATGQVDLISRIASASPSPLTTFEVCVKPNTLPKVLATMLAQGYADPEDTIVQGLHKVSKDFSEQDLAAWLSINHSKIACELLKLAADAGHGRESRPLQGLQLLAQLAYKKPTTGSGPRRSDVIATFLESNAWEIVTIFTTVFDETVTREMNVERRRCLKALGEIVKQGRGRVSFAIPSICACLRSAMIDPALCDAAYAAWSVMMLHLEDLEVGELLDQTLALTVSSWSLLNGESHSIATHMLKQLFRKRREAVKDRADWLPSLSCILALAEVDDDLQSMRTAKDEINELQIYVTRLKHETSVVVQLALTELTRFLREKGDILQQTLNREQPDPVFADLIRALLDCRVNFEKEVQIAASTAECLGALGRVDSSRVESFREKPTIIVLSNFAIAAESTSFLMFLIDHVVVKEYVSASSLRSKTFLGWALQELLKLCQMTPEIASKTRVGALSGRDRQWLDLPEETRLVLTPFLNSRFLAPGKRTKKAISYPMFQPALSFEEWLTAMTLDLLNKGLTQNVDLVFEICWRMVHFSRGTAIAAFLLPYAVLNVLINGTEKDKEDLVAEFLGVLQQTYQDHARLAQENIRQCSQVVFDVLDYLSRWLQDKRKWFSNAQLRAERGLRDPGLDSAAPQIQSVETLLRSIPPSTITQRSIECKSFARALINWEEYIHTQKEASDDDYRKLQDIYAQIDEPDGIEGISSCMHVLNAEAQILEHRKAGRWQAVQDWYETKLTEFPEDGDVQVNLLHALKESGQHDVLLHHFVAINQKSASIDPRLLSFATEAAWSTAQFDTLTGLVSQSDSDDFNLRLAADLLKLRHNAAAAPTLQTASLWLTATRDLSYNTTASIAGCGDTMLRTHVAEDLRLMSAANLDDKEGLLGRLDRRLNVLGTDVAAKHYVLNVQRAIMHLRNDVFNKQDIAASWLTTAKLARKARALNQAFDALLKAESLGDHSVVIEQAKLMWVEGRHRKAIKTLESAIDSGVFASHTYTADKDSMVSRSGAQEQNNTVARAYVLLGKWLDRAGQTQSEVIISTLRKSTDQSRQWERGWYHLGRHYNRILESEKAKPSGKESQAFLAGDTAKTVIDNFLRALVCGNKYLFQTLPKMLTLWLELVSKPDIEMDAKRGNAKFHEHLAGQRKKVINETNAYVKKYVDRLPPFALYTILPQLTARICHMSQQVHEILQNMIARVVHSFPQQALWTVLAMTKSGEKLRATRGISVLSKVNEIQKRTPRNMTAPELRTLITSAQKFTDELLRVADYHIEGKIPKVSLMRDLGFNHRIAPCKLVVPTETCLIPSIPISNDNTTRTFKAFPKEPVTISAFLDEALILASLQKPRKMSIRGSDGNIYSILVKPKDDLRKDQRLMEFDTMINRFLKRDIEASKRRLYIRTYAVIPLNEECGVIEWVNSLKTMRDVLLKLYRERNIHIDYGQLRTTLDDICTTSTNKSADFTARVLPLFPPVLRYWFIETFPDPSTWLQARIRYTRTTAVMSMVGHILGLGDRHGENILFEEDNGGIMHVDFNCLFDKGLTFDKPECVPFRLTHNMVDAFGTFGVEGPFRRSCEITMDLLRSHEDGLMTILETFLHDPTTDFMTAGKRGRKKDLSGLVPDTPERMLEGVRGKVRGMLPNESVPLSVGGYVEEMVKQATDRANLAKMYIGWCAFL